LRSASALGLAGLAGTTFSSLLAACGGSSSTAGPAASATATPTPEAQIPELTVSASDTGYTLPASASAGLTAITLVNTGAMTHQLVFRRLKTGKSMADFQAALKSPAGVLATFDLVDDLGGVITPAPGSTKQVVIELLTGDYVLHSRPPELAQGLIAPLSVGPAYGAELTEPTAARTVRLRDGVPADLPASVGVGRQIWEVRSEGTLHHNLALGRLNSGASLADLEAWLKSSQGSPPFVTANGINILSPAKRGWAYLDLVPGSYVGWCYVPGPKPGQNHLDDGHEVVSFTVS
jgi:hypothetical protein